MGSLLSKISSVLVVNMRAPAGCIMVLVGSCVFTFHAGALELRRDTFAAESTRAVVSRLAGLVQPELENILFVKLLLTVLLIILDFAGMHHHCAFQFEFHVHPPCSSHLFVVLCSL